MRRLDKGMLTSCVGDRWENKLSKSFGDLSKPNLTPQVQALFNNNPGIMYDFTNAAYLYQDSTRTIQVTASGQGIGSVTDLSPNLKNASSTGSGRPIWNGYSTFDAFDDYLQTAAVDFTATDKITVVAAVRKETDAAGMVVELSPSTATSPGSIYVASGNDGITGYTTLARGSASLAASQRAGIAVAAPDTAVVTAIGDIAGDLSRIFRNAVQGTDGTGDKGAGNFGNYALNIGARSTSSVFFNGRIYRLLVIGRALTTTERNTAERWAAQPVGIIIP